MPARRRKLAAIGTEADGLDPALMLDGRQGCTGVHVRQTCRAVIGPRRKLAPIGTEANGTDQTLVLDASLACPSPLSHIGVGYAGATYGGSISFQGAVRQAQHLGRRLPQLRMSHAVLPGFIDRAASRQSSCVFYLGKNHVQHMLW